MNRDLMKILDATEVFEETAASKGHSPRNHRKLLRLLCSSDFFRAIFRPTVDEDMTKKYSSHLMNMYEVASKPSVVRGLVLALDDTHSALYERVQAVFLVSLVNLGMSAMNSKATELGRRHDHDEITDEAYQNGLQRLQEYQDNLTALLEYSRGIVKREARAISRATNVPKKLCVSALYTVPTGRYLDQYKIGYYLDILLGNIYGFVDATDNIDYFDDIRWARFFEAVFGAAKVADVASLILVEGPERIAGYEKNPACVRACWDSLTSFALKNLNAQSDPVREHMIELYLKRVNRLLDKHGISLRIDLRSIDNLRFGKLADTISKYKSRFDDMMKKADVIRNASRDTHD